MERVLAVEGNRGVLQKLVFATLLMITLPVLTFFAFSSWGLAELFLGDVSPYKTAVSGGASVVLVQFIVVGYIRMAFNEDDNSSSKKQS